MCPHRVIHPCTVLGESCSGKVSLQFSFNVLTKPNVLGKIIKKTATRNVHLCFSLNDLYGGCFDEFELQTLNLPVNG